MDTFSAIYQRRAVKHYDPQHEFTDDEIRKLMESAIQSPTSFNIQNWRFVLVRDKVLRKRNCRRQGDQAGVAQTWTTSLGRGGRPRSVRLSMDERCDTALTVAMLFCFNEGRRR